MPPSSYNHRMGPIYSPLTTPSASCRRTVHQSFQKSLNRSGARAEILPPPPGGFSNGLHRALAWAKQSRQGS